MWRTPGGAPRIGMGCMRLSTGRDRDEARAIAVLHAALDAGVTFLDTADAYCHDEADVGHNERLIAEALATWQGDRSHVLVGTKGGLTRPHGGWASDGRARHLAAACEASLRALRVEQIALYQLHAPDPRVPLATSVRALATLQRDGLVQAIGLCNVHVAQIEEARRLVQVASVQVELSPWRDTNILNGVTEYCAAHGIALLAYRPLGGAQRQQRRLLSDPVLADLAARHRATPFEIALAWLCGVSDLVIPIPGATRVETAQSIARARDVARLLTDEDRGRLDAHFPAGRALRAQRELASHVAQAARVAQSAHIAQARHVEQTGHAAQEGPAADPPHDADAAARPDASPADDEVVLIMGLPGAGKSTLAQTFVARGYTRLNRDEVGGTLAGLLPALDRALAAGSSRLVLDNTYISRASRAAVIQTARLRGLRVRCLWLATSVEDAQMNAAWRMIARHGRLLADAEIKQARRTDAGAFAPMVQFRYQRELERPDAAEGFSRIDIVPFERRREPAFVHRALIVWCDGVLWQSRSGQRTPASADDVDVVRGRGEVMRPYHAEGWRLLGMSWQPEIAERRRSRADADAAFARLQALLGVPIEVEYCPHAAGPPSCWCRKPLPGLGVLFIQRHRLDPSQCLYVGAGPQDPGFARRLGFQYHDADAFFARGAAE